MSLRYLTLSFSLGIGYNSPRRRIRFDFDFVVFVYDAAVAICEYRPPFCTLYVANNENEVERYSKRRTSFGSVALTRQLCGCGLVNISAN